MKRTTVKRLVFSALLTSLSLVAQANPTIASNGVLASKEGKTLYTFTKDAAGKSNCNGGCATAWPPFVGRQPRARRRRVLDRHARRRREAVGLQGPAAVLLCGRHEAG